MCVRNDDAVTRLSAPVFETLVADTVRRLTDAEDPLALPVRIIIHEAALHIILPIKVLTKVRGRLADGEHAERDPADPQHMRLEIPTSLRLRGGRMHVFLGIGHQGKQHQYI